MHATETQLKDINALVNRAGLACTIEYPGYLAVKVTGLDLYLNVGTADGQCWGVNVVDLDGDALDTGDLDLTAFDGLVVEATGLATVVRAIVLQEAETRLWSMWDAAVGGVTYPPYCDFCHTSGHDVVDCADIDPEQLEIEITRRYGKGEI